MATVSTALARTPEVVKMVLSRSVSIGCQKPSCRYAANWPLAASRSSGSFSHSVSSPSMYSSAAGDRTKKPPLIQSPSPRGFSWKPVDAGPSIQRPKRPGGCTAVTVARQPS